MSIVTAPTASDVHVNTPLTNFGQKYLLKQDMFASMQAFPNIPVAKQSDLYYEWDRDDWLRDDMQERADGTESAGGSFDLSTEPYFCRVYAFHKDVTDRQRANQDNQVRLDEGATGFVMQKALIRREKVFANTFFKAGVWATDDSTQNWKTTGGGDPIEAIRDAKRTVHQNTGYRPNKMLFGREAYDALMDNDEVLARIEGGADPNMPAMVRRQLLAQLLELEAIYVMDAIETTSVKGATTPVRAFIGGAHALLYYAPTVASIEEPTAGQQFSWSGYTGATASGMAVSRFRMQHLKADRVEAEMAFDYKLTGKDLGYFFQNVTS